MTPSFTITGACHSAFCGNNVFVRCTGVPGVIIGRYPSAIQHPGWHARIIRRSERPRSLHVGRSDRSAWNAADPRLNSCRHQASGSLSLLHHSPKSESSFAQSLHVLSICLLHVPHHEGRKIGNARKSLGEIQNVQR